MNKLWYDNGMFHTKERVIKSMFMDRIQLQEGISEASLTAYLPDLLEGQEGVRRPAIILCPGGAYLGITEKEAEPVALRFLSDGFCAFVLRYSIGAGMAAFPMPFLDVARAIYLVRDNSTRWGIDSDNISLCGLSTGGHVAAVFAATWQDEFYRKALQAESFLFQPNALLLGYPLLNLKQFRIKNENKSLEMKSLMEMMFTAVFGTPEPEEHLMEKWNSSNLITSGMPRTFLWTTSEDSLVDVEECLSLIKALIENRIPYEFHVFEKGRHGVSLGDIITVTKKEDINNLGNTPKWVEMSINWLRK